MTTEYSFKSRRSPVIGVKGMVATSQPLAVGAGLEMLKQGGNAADAAVATAAALNVTEPMSTGIGGDVFALYYDAASGQITALNASGRSPQALTMSLLEKKELHNALPPYHPYTITVPGACSGWSGLIERHGNLTLDTVLLPAIDLAERGFPVAPVTAHFWERGVNKNLKHSLNGKELTLSGRAPQCGEIFKNPGLAQTLRTVADKGMEAFYQGVIAEAIVSVVKEAGGCLEIEDLASHQVTWEKPIRINYRGVNVWECPPNGQGIAALLALNILEGFEIKTSEPLSPQRLHLEVEALRLAFADARWYVSDPEYNEIPLEQLLSKSYAEERRKLIDHKAASLNQTYGTPINTSDTVYLTVVDEEGNACSFINSNYMGFGTGIVPQGCGFVLHNRGHNFDLNSDHPNAIGPNKRPYHTIIPGMITKTMPRNAKDPTKHEKLVTSFGVMGGFMQPQGHVQVVIGLIDDELDPQSALDRPRFCIMDGRSGGSVALEEGISDSIIAELEGMGHEVQSVSGYQRSVFGRGQIILKDLDTNILWGGSDPRADGCAMTY